MCNNGVRFFFFNFFLATYYFSRGTDPMDSAEETEEAIVEHVIAASRDDVPRCIIFMPFGITKILFVFFVFVATQHPCNN